MAGNEFGSLAADPAKENNSISAMARSASLGMNTLAAAPAYLEHPNLGEDMGAIDKSKCPFLNGMTGHQMDLIHQFATYGQLVKTDEALISTSNRQESPADPSDTNTASAVRLNIVAALKQLSLETPVPAQRASSEHTEEIQPGNRPQSEKPGKKQTKDQVKEQLKTELDYTLPEKQTIPARKQPVDRIQEMQVRILHDDMTKVKEKQPEKTVSKSRIRTPDKSQKLDFKVKRTAPRTAPKTSLNPVKKTYPKAKQPDQLTQSHEPVRLPKRRSESQTQSASISPVKKTPAIPKVQNSSFEETNISTTPSTPQNSEVVIDQSASSNDRTNNIENAIREDISSEYVTIAQLTEPIELEDFQEIPIGELNPVSEEHYQEPLVEAVPVSTDEPASMPQNEASIISNINEILDKDLSIDQEATNPATTQELNIVSDRVFSETETTIEPANSQPDEVQLETQAADGINNEVAAEDYQPHPATRDEFFSDRQLNTEHVESVDIKDPPRQLLDTARVFFRQEDTNETGGEPVKSNQAAITTKLLAAIEDFRHSPKNIRAVENKAQKVAYYSADANIEKLCHELALSIQPDANELEITTFIRSIVAAALEITELARGSEQTENIDLEHNGTREVKLFGQSSSGSSVVDLDGTVKRTIGKFAVYCSRFLSLSPNEAA